MSEITVQMRFADDGERQRYWRLREQPEMREAVGMGRWLAEKYALPRIYGNDGVRSPAQLGEMTKGFLEAGYVDAAAHHGRDLTDDEAFMIRMGYQAITLPALEGDMRTRQAGEKLGEGLALALAGLASCNEGLRLLGEPEIPSFLAPPHLLSVPTPPARRPLRPEDFGCLPAQPRR
ncbi:hypothetical protein Q8W71_06895 [Methylobacterium sp. NEAU 140]|uniref:hypothetical protein n=1 Tax=Methylobacterium sp. NEAU 140 TaxID=3064945 RepID=UPI0027342EB3|nr:hypothetical protein [Methylobacterium sp. NEAU 140]MDP4022344.1 hypothetical protein [Methylobacterium sp. NEAU 140]